MKPVKQTRHYQVVWIRESFISNRRNGFVSLRRECSLDEAVKHRLFFVNGYRLWQKMAPISQMKYKLDIDVSTCQLVRKTFKRI